MKIFTNSKYKTLLGQKQIIFVNKKVGHCAVKFKFHILPQ